MTVPASSSSIRPTRKVGRPRASTPSWPFPWIPEDSHGRNPGRRFSRAVPGTARQAGDPCDFEDNDSVDTRSGRFRLGALAAVLFALPAPTSPSGAEGEPAQGHSRVSDRMRGRELAAELPPLDNPEHRSVAKATHMRDEDLVLGVVVAGQA